MTTYVVGTAGHVDHGKSTLVKAMTGIDPDRLREEKERQLTIDLGFAWMTLPGGTDVGIVDVPGHRDFIENMLAGVGGIDAALLVVAVDEGVMPQTREHLEILDLLEIPRGVIALTKIDLIEEAGWIGLVEEEIRGLLAGTSLSKAPFYRVSSTSGAGIEELKAGLAELLQQTSPKGGTGRARIPVDRSFSLSGFGTIITGTLLDGRLEVGQAVQFLPSGKEGRIRGLQTHKRDVETAQPGSRVAANVSGVDADEVERGHVLVVGSHDRPTKLIDVQARVLSSSPVAIEHNQEVKLFVGSDQKIARVRVLGGGDRVLPGEEGWLQLMVRDPMVVRRADRFILRRPSPPLTLGGGRVVDPQPKRRHRLRDETVIHNLEKMLVGSQEDVITSALAKLGVASPERISQDVNLPLESVLTTLANMQTENQVIRLETTSSAEPAVMSEADFGSVLAEAEEVLTKYHQRHPLRLGMPMEELRSRLEIKQEIFPALLARLTERGNITRGEGVVHNSEFEPTPGNDQRKLIKDLLTKFEQAPTSPPTVKESVSALGDELYNYLLSSKTLVQLSEDVVFQTRDYERMVREVRSLIDGQGSVTIAEVRDYFDTSRKYVLALMEHLDEVGITKREGDERRLA